ncbi:MAG TPA: hypothetical protein ENJ27_01025 [Candidatus Moranbacteria bacterium]|nr:hypothetical protein [Candidatus Moranbacteria bacterium]
MVKVNIYSISKKERFQVVGEFFDVVAELNGKQDVIDFFIGLLTPSEALMLARRIQIAKLIMEDNNYEEIRMRLGVGLRTIQSVHKWLHKREGAYKKIMEKYLEKVKKENEMEKRKAKRYYTYTGLLNRYPQHRFLKDLLGL